MTGQSPNDLAAKLIACESITPATGAVFGALEEMLTPLGFEVHRFVAGKDESDPDKGPVENLFATRGNGGRHFAFAGHLDVVPPGEGWQSAPFVPETRGGLLYGRGAVDMKGAIACFVAALQDIPEDAGTISFIITGDEEGAALYGTRALIDWMDERGIRPDMCLVGEPSSVKRLGDTIKVGRRGSVNMWVRVEGTQGHVAYPHLADNPVKKLVSIMSDIEAIELDRGTEWFQPSNIEITDIHVGNPAHNVIPKNAEARLSIRFNDLHSGAELEERIRAVAEAHGGTLEAIVSGEPFLTQPGELTELVTEAIRDVTGLDPDHSTGGGTSDARFLTKLCPVVEFGLLNATMHKLDEAASLEDMALLVETYRAILRRAFGLSDG